MSIDTGDKKCAVCNAYLFKEDDVVHCPVCGAPHHRDCYSSLGHCGLEDLHGTDRQYTAKMQEKKEESDSSAEACAFCGKVAPEQSDFCPYCGSPKGVRSPFGAAFAPISIDSNTEIGEGVTVKELSPVILTNQARYFPRFIKLKEKVGGSWNWAAFLIPHGWFAFRKMYSFSWAFSLLMIISSLLTLPFNLAVTRLPGYIDLKGGSAELGRFVLENMDKIDSLIFLLAVIGTVLHLVIMLAGGLLGDRIYKKHTISVAKEIRKSEDKPTALRKKGGVSIFGFILATLAVARLPQLIFSLI